MLKIRAIPTLYKNVQFRSRLEARWAAFFDLLGWKWDYEPIDLQGWAPDFLIKLPIADVYVEVKPVETTEIDRDHVMLPRESKAWEKTDQHKCLIFVLELGARPQSSNYFSIGRLSDGPKTDVDWSDVNDCLRVRDSDQLWSEAGNIVQWAGR
jgi:hypothetical protein